MRQPVYWFRVNPGLRLLIWVLSLALTSYLLLSFSSFQASPYTTAAEFSGAFHHFPAFALAFYAWVALLLFLLITNSTPQAGTWEKLFVIWIFSTVFLLFSLVASPLGKHPDEWLWFDHLRYLQEEGHTFAAPIPLAYLSEHPGFFMLGVSLEQVTGLSPIDLRLAYLSLTALLLPTFLYLFSLKILKEASSAALASILAIAGSTAIGRYGFSPGLMAQTLMPVFMALLVALVTRPRVQASRLTLVLLFVAVVLVTSHFPTALLVVFVVAGILIMSRKEQGSIGWGFLALLLVIMLSWEMFNVAVTIPNAIGSLSYRLRELSPETIFNVLMPLAKANLGETVPMWSTLTLVFWIGLLGLVGSVIGLARILRVGELSLQERLETGGLLGALALTFLVGVGSPGGVQAVRYLFWGPLFTAPILVRTFFQRNRSRLGVLFLAGPLLVLSLPTFLSNNMTIGLQRFYLHELVAGQFLGEKAGVGEGLIVYSDSAIVPMLRYYVPKAELVTESAYAVYAVFGGMERVWKTLADFGRSFAELPSGEGSLFVLSDRMKREYFRLAQVDQDDSRWDEVTGTLSSSSMVYDNGYVQMYSR